MLIGGVVPNWVMPARPLAVGAAARRMRASQFHPRKGEEKVAYLPQG